MPPADSKLWRPGYHLLPKNRAMAMENGRQDLFSLNRSINLGSRKGVSPNPNQKAKNKTFAGVAREWFDNNAIRWVPTLTIETAKRTLHMAGAVFRYGVATGRCERDITADLRGALQPARKVKHRSSLSAKELPEFLISLNAYDGSTLTKLAMILLILTFVRTSEMRFARWSEFEDLDGKKPLWRIPAERMKMRRAHSSSSFGSSGG
jgi:integrase